MYHSRLKFHDKLTSRNVGKRDKIGTMNCVNRKLNIVFVLFLFVQNVTKVIFYSLFCNSGTCAPMFQGVFSRSLIAKQLKF